MKSCWTIKELSYREADNSLNLRILPPQVSEIQSRSAQMEVQNNHLDSDLKQCERNRKEAAAEAANQLQNKQRSHDDQVDYSPAVIRWV